MIIALLKPKIRRAFKKKNPRKLIAGCDAPSEALLVLLSKYRNVEVLDGRGRSPLYLASYTGIKGSEEL